MRSHLSVGLSKRWSNHNLKANDTHTAWKDVKLLLRDMREGRNIPIHSGNDFFFVVQRRTYVWKFFARTNVYQCFIHAGILIASPSTGTWASQSVNWATIIISTISVPGPQSILRMLNPRWKRHCRTPWDGKATTLNLGFKHWDKQRPTKRNSEPAGLSAVAWSEWGMPGGKYQRSPGP